MNWFFFALILAFVQMCYLVLNLFII